MINIGYAGLEAFDIILYIGRTLTKLNKRVLIIDLSGTGAMTTAINHGMGLDSNISIVNYRDLNYTKVIPPNDELKDFCDGVVIVNFGLNYFELTDTPIALNNISVVCNTLPSDIIEINQILKKINEMNNDTRILIRDVVNVNDLERTIKSLELSQKPKSTSYLYYSMDDYESAINCQVSQVVRFTNISSEMEKYIISEINSIFPDIKEKVIRKAISMARKGV